VNAQLALATVMILSCTWLPALGQESGTSAPVDAATVTPVKSERQVLSEADQKRQQIASSLGDYLVAFNSRYDTDNKRVGIPLASFARSSIQLAYDPTNRQMMAQWNLGSIDLLGQKFRYQAYVDGTGSAYFVLSARF
jgi:hypothetical protein